MNKAIMHWACHWMRTQNDWGEKTAAIDTIWIEHLSQHNLSLRVTFDFPADRIGISGTSRKFNQRHLADSLFTTRRMRRRVCLSVSMLCVTLSYETANLVTNNRCWFFGFNCYVDCNCERFFRLKHARLQLKFAVFANSLLQSGTWRHDWRTLINTKLFQISKLLATARFEASRVLALSISPFVNSERFLAICSCTIWIMLWKRIHLFFHWNHFAL